MANSLLDHGKLPTGSWQLALNPLLDHGKNLPNHGNALPNHGIVVIC